MLRETHSHSVKVKIHGAHILPKNERVKEIWSVAHLSAHKRTAACKESNSPPVRDQVPRHARMIAQYGIFRISRKPGREKRNSQLHNSPSQDARSQPYVRFVTEAGRNNGMHATNPQKSTVKLHSVAAVQATNKKHFGGNRVSSTLPMECTGSQASTQDQWRNPAPGPNSHVFTSRRLVGESLQLDSTQCSSEFAFTLA